MRRDGFWDDTLRLIVESSNCPFAEGVWESGKVGIMEGGQGRLIQEVCDWDDSYEVLVFIPTGHFLNTYYQDCLNWEEGMARNDLIAIPNAPHRYILLQRLSELVSASNTLIASGFYDSYTSEQISHVLRRRRLAQEWPSL